MILSGCLSLRTSDKDVKRVLEAYAAEDKVIEQQKSAAADAGIHTLSVAPANGTFNVTADLDHARLDRKVARTPFRCGHPHRPAADHLQRVCEDAVALSISGLRERAFAPINPRRGFSIPASAAAATLRLDSLRDVPTGAAHLASILRAP